MNLHQNHVNQTDIAKKILQHLTRCSKTPHGLVLRVKIIPALASGKGIRLAARELKIDKKTVKKWCRRQNEAHPGILTAESDPEITPKQYSQMIIEVFNDKFRCDAPAKFTAEEIVHIVSIACEVIDDSDRPYSRWTYREIADEAVDRDIVESISPSTIGRFLSDA